MKGLVIIPTYNERENIAPRSGKGRDSTKFGILDAVHHYLPEADILIVDDASPDGTAEVVKKKMKTDRKLHILEREGKLGLGTAYIEGFKWAIAHGFDYAFEMDADFSHDPRDLPRFVREIEDGADLVIGSRYVEGGAVEDWPRKRMILSHYANIYARLGTSAPIRDLTAGYKCYRTEVFSHIRLDEITTDGYGFQIEIDYRVWRAGFKVKEIPICFLDRRVGVSKLNRRIVWQALFLVPRLWLWNLWR
ncbi:polyprenol monophosphomannose synthase [candidate division WOR-3 bacterium]|nr:polyprenol monophosphomannose synthase [candidate division WOR-3 bacterium]